MEETDDAAAGVADLGDVDLKSHCNSGLKRCNWLLSPGTAGTFTAPPKAETPPLAHPLASRVSTATHLKQIRFFTSHQKSPILQPEQPEMIPRYDDFFFCMNLPSRSSFDRLHHTTEITLALLVVKSVSSLGQYSRPLNRPKSTFTFFIRNLFRFVTFINRCNHTLLQLISTQCPILHLASVFGSADMSPKPLRI